jgi:integrase/recombinase XerD
MSRCKTYGYWLRFLKDHRCLDSVTAAGDRLTESNLRAYIVHARERLAPQTVVTRLGHLSSTIAAMDPKADRSLLNLAINRLSSSVHPVRNKSQRLVPPTTLYALGQALMRDWQQRRAHDPRLNAMDYRDGLMIAYEALCPLRLENLAQMLIGQHLAFEGEEVWVRFAAREMKSKRALEFQFPAELRQHLQFYLSRVRPMLVKGTPDRNALWPSLHHTQMTEHGIYTRITQATQKALGRPVNPHMFRDAAATFIAEMAPEHAMLAAAVLQHRELETVLAHYIHGQQHLVLHRYHGAIHELIARVAAEPLFEE